RQRPGRRLGRGPLTAGSLRLRDDLLHPPPVHLSDVDDTLRIDSEHVWQVELPRAGPLLAEAAQGLAGQIEHLDPVGAAVSHEQAVLAEEEAEWRPALPELREELAVGVEDLDAVVLAVADVDAALFVEADGVRQVELALALALLTPLLQQLALFRELQHPRVAVAVGDVEVAGGSHGHLGRAVEAVRAVALRASLAQRQEQFALGAELHDTVAAHVGDPDVILRIDPQPVPLVDPFATEGAEELAVGVEDE